MQEHHELPSTAVRSDAVSSSPSGGRASWAWSLARGVVVTSTFGAIGLALWPLTERPAVFTSVIATLGVALISGYRHSRPAAIVLCLFAYCSYGVVRLLAGPVVAGIPYWLAAFAGLALGMAVSTGWQSARPWRLPLIWWATTVAVCWPIVAGRLLALGAPSSLTTSPVATAALLQMSLALWMDGLLAVRGDSDEASGWPRPADVLWPLAVSAVLSGAAATLQALVWPAWLSGEPWISLRRSVGLMGDANPLGVATALWAPLVLTLPGRASVGLRLVLAVVLWSGAWASGSRSIVVLLAAGLVACGLTWRRGPLGGSRAEWARAAAILVVVGLVVSQASTPGSPVGRLFAMISERSVTSVLYEVAWRRDGYGLAAVEAIREKPFFGVGIGTFNGSSTRYYQQLTGTAIPPDNAQNLWRHTLAEQGIVGLAPILWLTFLVLGRASTMIVSGVEPALGIMLLAIGLILLVGHPVENAAIAVTVGTLVAAAGEARAGVPRR
jgi:O-antigen ligase